MGVVDEGRTIEEILMRMGENGKRKGLYEEPESGLIIPTLTEQEEREEARERSAKRDEIAQTMWTDYMARNIEEAQKGNRPSNTFKTISINKVAEAISKRFQVQCNAKHVENHLRTVKNQWQIICTIRGESGFGWDDNMKMITCDRATYDAAVMVHKKYEPFLNKSIDHYDEMTLVVGKDMAIGSFARTFADKIWMMGEQLSKIANALEQPHLYEEVMSMEVEGFDDDFLCSVFDYLVSHESEAKAFLVKSKKHRKIWLQKFSQG
ncbi:hypothetical protein GOBAR_AA32586 [Gossypium barbadense]|uniref:Myb/SANT-like domain-containing protein n=1 Tax=Gossypium barbadense TaxID=3634 RepID=A0A2P5WAI1_GOSBA|nr:hypothetical protein GOBAR_AA32586 [Gossypium barbadense]